ncbi:MAG: single-stranded-DNA-specific exonuclease [Candidatus Omnitrophota bacterium]
MIYQWLWRNASVAPDIDLPKRILEARDIALSHLDRMDLSAIEQPTVYTDIHAVHTRILKAKSEKQPILIYGDYDADGITGSSILHRALSHLECLVEVYIPERISDGYGLNSKAALQQTKNVPSLIITCDNGLGAQKEILTLESAGYEVIVVDHHLSPETDPIQCLQISPHKYEGRFKQSYLSGAGLAWILAWHLCGEQKARELLPLAAIGTIADLVPCLDGNRVITKLGLLGLSHTTIPGLRELLRQCNFYEGETISSRQVAFEIAPRINAAGRMNQAFKAVQAFVSDDPLIALHSANELHLLNARRKELDKIVTRGAIDQIERSHFKDSVILCAKSEGWSPGVIGIAASRLKQKYNRPSIVIAINGETAIGSGRSIDNINLHTAIKPLKHLMTAFGGHAQAIGFSMPADNLDEFIEALKNDIGDKMDRKLLRKQINIDAKVGFDEIQDDAIEQWFENVGPYGKGFEEPVFVLENQKVILINGDVCRLEDKASHKDMAMVLSYEVASRLRQGDTIDALVQISTQIRNKPFVQRCIDYQYNDK